MPRRSRLSRILRATALPALALAALTACDSPPLGDLAPTDAGPPPPDGGVEACLSVQPRQLDFGLTVVETSASRTIEVANACDEPLPVQLILGNNTKLCSRGASDPSVFCLRARALAVDADQRLLVPAGASAEIEVRFSPRLAGARSDGSFAVQLCASAACQVRVDLTGLGVESGLRCRPAALEFGEILPGSTSTRNLSCQNLANTQITIVSWALTDGSSPAFEAEASRPQVLNPGDTLGVEVSFTPSDRSEARGVLRLQTDAVDRRYDVALSGTGGGPRLSVLPAQLDFGRVSLIAPVRRQLIINSSGFAPAVIREIEVDTLGTGAFTSPNANANVLGPGESLNVSIEFAPRVVGPVASIVRVVTNDPAQSALEIRVRGEGVNLPPCEAALPPTRVSFGAVQRGRTLQRAVIVRNRGTVPCLLTAVRLLGGSDPAFSLPELEAPSVEIPPGAAHLVPVSFRPSGAGVATGRVELWISNPRTPVLTVELSGTGVDSAPLVAPERVDFGTVGAGCRAPDRGVVMYPPPSEPTEIVSIQLEAAADPAFRLSNLPTLPRRLSETSPLVFDVGFRPEASTAYAGAVSIGARVGATSRDFVLPLEGRAERRDARQIDEHTQLGSPKVDVLLVLDRSRTMAPMLAALQAALPALVDYAEAAGVDYNIGVTTTDIDVEAGRLVSAPPGTTTQSSVDGPPQLRLVTPRTLPSPVAALTANMSFVHGVIGREGLEAAARALTGPPARGHNAGLLRPDAALAVVFVSDAPDASPHADVRRYVDALRSVRGAVNPNQLAVAFIGGPLQGCLGVHGAARSLGRYEGVTARAGGELASICETDWTPLLRGLAPQIFGVRSKVLLRQPPIASTLEVSVDGAVLPERSPAGSVNWSFDPVANAVAFAPSARPGPGARVRVEYVVECR